MCEAANRQQRLRAQQERERREGFALDTAPLMKLSLLRLGEQRYYLSWSHHHLLLDGWCTAIVLKELFDLYEGVAAGTSSGGCSGGGRIGNTSSGCSARIWQRRNSTGASACAASARRRRCRCERSAEAGGGAGATMRKRK